MKWMEGRFLDEEAQAATAAVRETRAQRGAEGVLGAECAGPPGLGPVRSTAHTGGHVLTCASKLVRGDVLSAGDRAGDGSHAAVGCGLRHPFRRRQTAFATTRANTESAKKSTHTSSKETVFFF